MSIIKQHREEFRVFVINESEENYRGILSRLYENWDTWDNEFFGSEFTTPPYITLSAPDYIGHFGSYGPVSDFGGGPHIKIRPALLGNRHARTRNLPEEGKILFVRDVLLHQMVHEYLDEVLGLDRKLVQGHGDEFVRKCNQIGEKLGLAPVGTPNPPKSEEKLPSAGYWPHGVRPSGYYGGPYTPRNPMEDLLDYLEKTVRGMSSDRREVLFDRLKDLVYRFLSNKGGKGQGTSYKKI